jgi:hypothetical protein
MTSIHQLIKQALKFRFLTPGQLSQLQSAASIIDGVMYHAGEKGDEAPAGELRKIRNDLEQLISDREEARQRYLNENRLPDAP